MPVSIESIVGCDIKTTQPPEVWNSVGNRSIMERYCISIEEHIMKCQV